MQNRFFGQEQQGINSQVFWKDYFLTTTRHSSSQMEAQISGAQNVLVPEGGHGENHLSAICESQVRLCNYQEMLERVRMASPAIPLREHEIIGSGLRMVQGGLILGVGGLALELGSAGGMLSGFLFTGSGVAIITAVTAVVAGILGSHYAKEYEGVLHGIQDSLRRQDFEGAQDKLESEMYNRSIIARITRSAFLEKMHFALAHFYNGLITEGRAFLDITPDKKLLKKACAEYTIAAKDAAAAGLKAKDLLLIIRMQHLRLLQHAMHSEGVQHTDRLAYSKDVTDGVRQLEEDFGSTLNTFIERHIGLMLACRSMMGARYFDPSAVNLDALDLLLAMPCQFIFANMNKTPAGHFMALTSAFFRAQVLGYWGHVEGAEHVKIPASIYRAIESDLFSLYEEGLLPLQRGDDQDRRKDRQNAAAKLIFYLLVGICRFREQYPDFSREPSIGHALEYMSDYAAGFVLAHSQMLDSEETRSLLDACFKLIESNSQFAFQYKEHEARSQERLREVRRLRLDYGLRIDSHETVIDALYEPEQPRLLAMLGDGREAMVEEVRQFPRETMPNGVRPEEAALFLKKCVLMAELEEYEYKCEAADEPSNINRILASLERDIDSQTYVPVCSKRTGRTLLHWLTKLDRDCAVPDHVRCLTEKIIKYCHVQDFENNTAEMLLAQSDDPCNLMPIFNRYRIILKQHALIEELKNDFDYKFDEEMDFEGVLSSLSRDIGMNVPVTLQSNRTGRSLLHWLADFSPECIQPIVVRELTEKLIASRYLRDHENRTPEILLQQSGDPCKLIPVYDRHNARRRSLLMDSVDSFIDKISRGGNGGEHFMLLEGPPGTGKTTTVTNYLRTAHQDTVQLHEWVRGAEGDQWCNQLEARIEKFFRTAEEAAHEAGKVQMLFIDEIDAICPEVLGQAKVGISNQRDIVQLFQIKTSALKERSLPIALIGATNYPENLARPMLNRASTNRLVFPLPALDERLQLLQHELRFVSVSSDCVNKMAAASHGWSHRQLVDVCIRLREAENINNQVVQNEFANVIRQFESEFASKHAGAKLHLPVIRMDDNRDPFENVSGVDRHLADTFRQLHSWFHVPVPFEDSPRRHMLLHGKPGGGKTYAISKLLKNANVPFISIDKPLSAEEYVRLFAYAGQFDHAVLFIDEIDAIFRIPLVAESLQTHMDGMKHSGIIVMAATNYPQELPEAIFDRFTTMIRVPPMSVEQKQAFIRDTILSALQGAGLESDHTLNEEIEAGCPNIAEAADTLSLRCILSALRIAVENRAMDAMNGDHRISAADIMLHLRQTVAARRQALYGGDRSPVAQAEPEMEHVRHTCTIS